MAGFFNFEFSFEFWIFFFLFYLGAIFPRLIMIVVVSAELHSICNPDVRLNQRIPRIPAVAGNRQSVEILRTGDWKSFIFGIRLLSIPIFEVNSESLWVRLTWGQSVNCLEANPIVWRGNWSKSIVITWPVLEEIQKGWTLTSGLNYCPSTAFSLEITTDGNALSIWTKRINCLNIPGILTTAILNFKAISWLQKREIKLNTNNLNNFPPFFKNLIVIQIKMKIWTKFLLDLLLAEFLHSLDWRQKCPESKYSSKIYYSFFIDFFPTNDKYFIGFHEEKSKCCADEQKAKGE